MFRIANPMLFIQLFADGGAAASGSASNASASAESSGSAAPQATVLYGKQTPGEAETTTTSTPAAERSKAFSDLISGEYRDEYNRSVQSIIDRRFKESKATQAKLDAQEPIIAMLSDKYGITDGDAAKLVEAISKDDRYWEEAADEAGMTVDQYREVKRLQRENAKLKKATREKQEAEAANRQFAVWNEQAQALKAEMPSFDIRKELSNPNFGRLLQAGLDVKTAFEVVHRNDINSAIAKGSAQRAEKTVTDTIRARGLRPRENGSSSAPGVTIKSNVQSLTAADRREIAKQVRNGKRITF